MTYHIIVIGCQMNKADGERCAAYLEARGFRPAKNEAAADIVILTTCGVRQSAEDRVYGLVNQIKKKNPRSLVVITGCLSRRPDVRQRLKGKVDIWLPISDLPLLEEKILANKKSPYGDILASRVKDGNEANLTLNDIIASQAEKSRLNNRRGPAGSRTPEDYLSIAPKYSSKFTAFIPIGNGCNNFCSYCVVPYARGREVYRPAAEIIGEVRRLVKNGYKEINLIAQNVNSYRSGYDSNLTSKPKAGSLDFPGLLRKVNALPGDFWIRFFSSHPKDMSLKLIKALAECPKVCEHIHLAVQSGDDQILAAMNRKYTAAHYKNLIKKLRAAFKKRGGLPLAVTTDLIVGFPGETRTQFLNSVKLFKEIKFDMAYIARYSPRFGTVSAKMEDSVSREEKKRRENELNEVLAETALANNKKYLGKTAAVLVSGQNKSGEFYGQTRTAKNVRIAAGRGRPGGKSAAGISPEKIIGRIVPVKITAVQDFGLAGIINEKNFKNKETKKWKNQK